MRYQVRLGNSDISLWTKEVGEKYYICTPIQAYGPLPDIMDDDFTISTQGPSNPNKMMRSLLPPAPAKRQCNDADSSLEDEALNQAMDDLDAARPVDPVTNVSQSVNTNNANL